MRAHVCLVIVLMAMLSACAPKTTPLPVAGTPRYPEFIEPAPPADLAASPAARTTARAWLFLQAGDARSAEREAAAALKVAPSYYPAQTTAAYAALARKDARSAATIFARVTETHPAYVPALVGQGLALEASGDVAGAVVAYRAALEQDETLPDISRRVDVMTLRGLQDELAAARQASKDGRREEAVRAYRNAIAASPESAFLYRELAAVERDTHPADAVAHLTRAHELEPGDAQTLVLLGELYEQDGQLDSAIRAYSDALTLDADPVVAAKRDAVRAALDLAALPEQYRAIGEAKQVTRADLAALLGVRVPTLVSLAPVRDIGVLTDLRGQWAERWIVPVARAGIIEAFPNHTFQPRGVIRRVDLAQAVAKMLNVMASSDPGRSARWSAARGRFTDMTASHLAYPAVSMAVAAGVLAPTETGAFQPTRGVTGAEAVDAVEHLRRLAAEVIR